jgi:short-subunit dehydrogenase
MTSFADKVVVITGAASGIGRQFALTLAAEGAKIAGVDIQAEGLDSLQSQLKDRCAVATANVVDQAALLDAVAGLEKIVGPADMLIASAGIGRETTALTFDPAEVNEHIRINLEGVVNSIGAVLPGMIQRRAGHLVVLSSLASYRGLPLMGAYCASKAGLNALMDALRVELKMTGIACTTLCPCWVRTPLTANIKVATLKMMEVEDAVSRMLKAIRARKAFYAFPAGDAWQVRLLKYLPGPISDWLTLRFLRRLKR